MLGLDEEAATTNTLLENESVGVSIIDVETMGITVEDDIATLSNGCTVVVN